MKPAATREPARPHDDAGVLAARALACRRGRRTLFRGLDARFERGSVTWLRGSNGSGKTSLLRILAGLSQAAEGTVSWEGVELRRAGMAARRGLLYIGHANALKDDLSVAEALEFLLRIHGRTADRASIAAALDYWGMAAHARSLVRRLSQGQRRRVALARLAAERDATLWLLDEPFDALDTDGVQRLVALLERHLQRGGSVLLTGHQTAPESSLRIRELDLDARAS